MPGGLSVLLVGSLELAESIQDALKPCRPSCISSATGYWELCALSLHETSEIELVILDHSFSDRQLRDLAEYIRRRWADAAILWVSTDCNGLDDPLYDERVPPNISPAELAAVGIRMVERKKRSKRNWSIPAFPTNDGVVTNEAKVASKVMISCLVLAFGILLCSLGGALRDPHPFHHAGQHEMRSGTEARHAGKGIETNVTREQP